MDNNISGKYRTTNYNHSTQLEKFNKAHNLKSYQRQKLTNNITTELKGLFDKFSNYIE